MLQVQAFFRSGSYNKVPGFVVKMDKVPGLPDEVKLKLRKYLVNNKSMGIHNVPRRFEVCNNIIKHTLAFYFHCSLTQAKGKSEKCTVVIATAFSLTCKPG